jgi:hypothetical protein
VTRAPFCANASAFAWRASSLILALSVALTGCPVDNRELEHASFDPSVGGGDVMDGGGYSGVSSGGGHAGAGADGGGAGGAGSSGASGAGSDGGSSGAAGSGSVANDGGSGGSELDASLGGGGQSGHAGVGGNSGSGGNIGGNGGISGTAGATSAAGATTCPDLDQDSIPDCQESLLRNPAFDVDDSSWLAEPDVLQTWLEMDAHGRVASGSLSVENTLVLASDGLVFRGSGECIAIPGGQTYRLMAEVLLQSGQDPSGSGAINVTFHETQYCSGDTISAATSNLASTFDAWNVLSCTATAPVSARSMNVRLVVLKSFTANPVTALFDDVLVATE